MKKILVVAILCMICFTSFSQVTLVKEDATKVYPKGNRITYFTVDGFETYVDFFDDIKKSLVDLPNIYRFSYMDKTGTLCMYDADASVTPEQVILFINKFIEKFENENDEGHGHHGHRQ